MSEDVTSQHASAEAIAELIALEKQRQQRERDRSAARRRAIALTVIGLIVVAFITGVILNKQKLARDHEQRVCIFTYTQQNIDWRVAEELCD